MEDFIGYTIKEKIDTLLTITLIPIICLIALVEGFTPIAPPLLFLFFVPFYFIKEKRNVWNKYKIENNSLIVKKITKSKTFNFEELEKVIVKKQIFSLKFPKETINIYFDKKTSQLVEFFYKNNIETIYTKKFSELNESKRLINLDESATKKHRRLDVIIIFFISVLCSIDLIIERTNDLAIYIFLAISVFCSVMSFVAFLLSFTKKKYSSLEQEYIDKNGFHLLNQFIPFSEIEEMVRIIKKWGIIKLKIKTKKNEEYEISTFGFDGDILYEMYLQKKINT